MAKKSVPDPLKPGHIQGQNPATPERMPGHTGYYSDEASSAAGNEEDLGGRPAFLFRSGKWAGVTLDSSGQNLPKRDDVPWQLDCEFTLGIRHAAPENVTPEQIIRGIHVHGYYIWRPDDPSRTGATTQ
jgi:hypothetical protein